MSLRQAMIKNTFNKNSKYCEIESCHMACSQTKTRNQNFCATIKKTKLNHKEQILGWKININNGFYINFIRDCIKILCLPVFHSLQREFLEKTKWYHSVSENLYSKKKTSLNEFLVVFVLPNIIYKYE